MSTATDVTVLNILSKRENSSVLLGDLVSAIETEAATAVVSSDISSTAGAVKVHRYDVGFADLNTAGSGVALLLGTAVPDNAVVLRTYIDITATFAGDGDDSSTIKIGLEDQDNDVVAAAAIKTGTPWDAGLHEGIQDGTMANALKLTAARQLAVKWTAVATDTALTAGAMTVFVEFVVGQ